MNEFTQIAFALGAGLWCFACGRLAWKVHKAKIKAKAPEFYRARNPDGSAGATVKAGVVIPDRVVMHPTAVILSAEGISPGQIIGAGEIWKDGYVLQFGGATA